METKRNLLTGSLLCFAASLFIMAGCAQQPVDHTDKLIYDQLLRPESAEYYHVPIGLCEDYPEETTTMEIIRGDMELLKRTDIDLLRISFGWDGIETAKDQYEWLFWDDYVKMAVEDYDVTLIPYICYTPMWNSTGDSINYWNHIPEDFEEFGEFMGDLVNRYKNYIKTWELWNEPDIKIYWSGTAEEYARLVKIGSAAVRKADPEAIVVLGGIAHRPEWLLELFRDHDISSYVDIVNIHNYYETWSPHALEDMDEYVDEVHDIVAEYGDGQAIWMAEVGYSSYRGAGGRVSDSYTAYYDYEHTPEFQAVQLIRTLTLALSTDKLAAITWYEIKNLPQSEDVIGDEYNNRYLGVANYDFKPKPAEKALTFFNKLFSAEYKSIDADLLVQRKLDSHSEIHGFQTREGDVIVVGWLKTNFPGRKPDESGQVKDTREETVSIELPMVLAGTATQYDELGNSTEFTRVEVSDTSTTLNDIALKGGEVVIVKVTKNEVTNESASATY